MQLNTFYRPCDLAGATERVAALRRFDPALAMLIDQPEILDIRKWEYCCLLTVLEAVSPSAHMLDVGCGRSLLSMFLSTHVARTLTVDLPVPFQQQSEEQEKRRLMNLSHVQADVRQLPFAAGSFDVVYSISAIEHLQEAPGASVPKRPYEEFVDDTCVALRQMARLVRPGGVFYVTSDLFDPDRQRTDAWRPKAAVMCAYDYRDFQRVFIDTLVDEGLAFEDESDFDFAALDEDAERATYRGRYFTTFALSMRRPGSESV